MRLLSLLLALILPLALTACGQKLPLGLRLPAAAKLVGVVEHRTTSIDPASGKKTVTSMQSWYLDCPEGFALLKSGFDSQLVPLGFEDISAGYPGMGAGAGAGAQDSAADLGLSESQQKSLREAMAVENNSGFSVASYVRRSGSATESFTLKTNLESPEPGRGGDYSAARFVLSYHSY
ncbi:hypothetical protein IT575_05255 [bacterium]|nr:hypothetical protein [bacterium]